MRPVTFDPDTILDCFRKHKVLTKQAVLDEVGCQTMTFWNALHGYERGYFTSYNYNAKYYTLGDIPKFDERGLWCWSRQQVRFSRYGTLSETAIELVAKSEAGYEAKELTELLGVRMNSELTRFYQEGRIEREKIGPTFVYFALKETVRVKQVEARKKQFKAALERSVLPEPDLVIAVLVELIKSPGLSPPAVFRRLSRRGTPLSRKQIENIFTRYELAGKKGR